MKNTLLLFLLGLLLFTGCERKRSKVTINGTITGIEAEELYYSVPIDGTSYPYFRDTISISLSKEFLIEVETEYPVFITIQIPETTIKKGEYNHNSMTLPILPGQQLKLNVTSENGAIAFVAEGEYAQAVNTYMNLPIPPFYEFPRLFHLLTPEEVVSSINELKEKDSKEFQNLKEKGEITSDMFDLIANDIDCYYALATIYSFMSKVTGGAVEEPLKKIWLDVYKQYPLNDNSMIASSYWYDYTFFYINSLLYFIEEIDMEMLQGLHKEGKIKTFFLELAGEKLSGKRIEYYTAAYLFTEALQRNYEKELTQLYEQFVVEYPKSKYLYFVTGPIEEIYSYYRQVDQPAKETIRILENYEHISSLQEALASFKGKKVYVDIWATWCPPCKKEFAYKEAFHKWALANGYELLYISIDREEVENKWLEMIKYYDLEGYHIRASENLGNDLRHIYDQNGGLSIPWYIEIDEQGDIREKYARRPSEIVKEIEK